MKNFQQKSANENQKDLKLYPPSVREYMTRKLITFKPETPVTEVIDTLMENKITGAPVLNDRGEVVGLIDDKDCLKMLVSAAYYNQPVDKDTVADYMSNVMKSISVNDTILDVANTFISSPFKRLLVVGHDDKLLGQISRVDVLRAIQDMNANTW